MAQLVAVICGFREAEEKKKSSDSLSSVCLPSPLSPVKGAILRDEPLCSGRTLRGYCHHEVGAGEIPRERVGREGDRRRQKKGK